MTEWVIEVDAAGNHLSTWTVDDDSWITDEVRPRFAAYSVRQPDTFVPPDTWRDTIQSEAAHAPVNFAAIWVEEKARRAEDPLLRVLDAELDSVMTQMSREAARRRDVAALTRLFAVHGLTPQGPSIEPCRHGCGLTRWDVLADMVISCDGGGNV